jgi:heme A synthase
MRAGVLLFYGTGLMVFSQLFVGGMVVFGFVLPAIHIATGFITLGFAACAMAAAIASKPSYRPVKVHGILILALVVIQGLLGFIVLGTGSPSLTLVHFANALLIYGLAVSGALMARRWNVMPLTEKQGPVALAVSIAFLVVVVLFVIGHAQFAPT